MNSSSVQQLRPRNIPSKYDALFNDIDQGRIKIPKFQRDFVWSKNQTGKLIDSIIKGFPIGTFIFWKTKEEMRTIKNIGNIDLPETPQGEQVSYVLDGQQRITSLYAVRKGIRLSKDGDEIDYKDICINLDVDPNADDEVVFSETPQDATSISVHELLNFSITALVKKYTEQQLERIEIYKTRLTTYDFSTIVIDNYPLDIACEVFTRINTGGTELTLFEIMVAKTFDPDRDFDLMKKYKELINGNGNGKKCLSDANFETIPESTVLQCIAAHIGRRVRRNDILKLDKNEFINSWDTVMQGIFMAVDYLRQSIGVKVSKLLPYNALIIPFSVFFIQNQFKPPTYIQDKLLKQYFWWASLSTRFTSGQEGKITQDIDRISLILNEEGPSYRGEEVQISVEDLQWKWFSTGDGFCKALLCLYASKQPKSLLTNADVNIDNSWLTMSTSKNYHHFFPRNYLISKRGYPNWKANVILNIVIVDDYLNKRKIGTRAPSDYINDFSKDNPEIVSSLESHLIGEIGEFGITKNEYEKFLRARANLVISEINKKLKPSLSES
jgi:hypothetical protein